MDKWQGKVAVVTGTTSGIGLALATQLVDLGVVVVGLSRRTDRGVELVSRLRGRKGAFHHLTTDVGKEEDVASAFRWIRENLGGVSILVNNAGTRRSTSLVDGDAKMWRETLDVNVVGLCLVTREAVRSMRANGIDGHVVIVNSMAGHRVPPLLDNNIYPASKFAVTGIAETLRQDLNAMGSKIKVTAVSPGLVATEIFEVSKMDGYIKSLPQLQPEDVANIIVYVLSTPLHVQIHDILVRPQGQLS
ncbi:farnesol dehydrogenase-like [Photinus pyralis]|nr:farnesol dehydrogenase-like [Photinus pyralis]